MARTMSPARHSVYVERRTEDRERTSDRKRDRQRKRYERTGESR